MRQTLFMIVATVVGVGGAFTYGPAIAVSVYYFFAVLRPQYMWQWALPSGIAWSQFVAVSAIAALVLSRLFGFPHPPERSLKRTAVFWAFIAFAVWICVTYVTARRPDVSWPWFIEYLKIFTMFLVGAACLTRLSQLWTTFVLVAVALIYIAYEINALYVFDGRLDVYHRGYGGLDNNGAGLMIAMGVPLALYAWEGTAAWWRWGYAAALLPMIHAVMMTYSRGAMLSLIIASPLIVMRSRRRLQFTIIAAVLAAFVPVMAGQEIRSRFFSIQRYEQDQSANSRLDSWAAAIRIANDNPIFGVGIRNSNLYSQQYGADMQGRTIHSQYLQTLADSGYPALALYLTTLGLLFLSLRRSRRHLRSSVQPDPRAVAMVSGVECSLVVFAVGGMFLSLEVFELPYVLILLGGQLAAMSFSREQTTVNVPKPTVSRIRVRTRVDRVAPTVPTRRPVVGWKSAR